LKIIENDGTELLLDAAEILKLAGINLAAGGQKPIGERHDPGSVTGKVGMGGTGVETGSRP